MMLVSEIIYPNSNLVYSQKQSTEHHKACLLSFTYFKQPLLTPGDTDI